MSQHSLIKTAAQVAEHCGVGRQTVLNWYHSGVIPAAFHVGDVIRFDLDEVLAALAERQATTSPKR